MSTVRETKLTSDSTIERWLDAYRRMAAIRAFEERVNELYRSAKMPGLAHLYIGEEAVAVGICKALRKDDYITSTHRGHGHCLAKGAAADRMFGEGALGQGVLYEVMNMASLWKLPVIYACENNLYNEYTHYSETTAGDLVARGEAFGIAAEQVDGQDVRAVFDAAVRAVARARRGDGPTFLVLNTYRFHGHHVGDVDRSYYRSEEEETEWKSERDPIELLTGWLREQGVVAETLAQIRSEAQQEVEAGVEFALAAPYPDESEVDQHVFA